MSSQVFVQGEGMMPSMVYALGKLGVDFGTEARRDFFAQMMPSGGSLLDYLDQNPDEAQSLIWTLNSEDTPIYAIEPKGAYASMVYERLRQILTEGDSVEQISVPGRIAGNIRLLSGQTIPVIIPELRGIYSLNSLNLVDSFIAVSDGRSTRENIAVKIKERLEQISYEFRNLGITPQERALNFSVTNVFQVTQVWTSIINDSLKLGTIEVTKSPICRPDSDCYDVKLTFLDFEDSRRASKVYRFTVDVSEVMPVTIGEVRSWSES